MPSVIVADDQAVVRAGFRVVLDAADDIDVSPRPATAPRLPSWPSGCGPTWW